MPLDMSIQSSAGANDVQLVVALSGGNINVAAGIFKVADTSYELLADEDHDLVSNPSKSWLVGYLVRQVSDDSIHVLVDHYADPSTERYMFDDGLYERLWLLFAATLAPAETDLETNSTVQVLHIVPAVEE